MRVSILVANGFTVLSTDPVSIGRNSNLAIRHHCIGTVRRYGRLWQRLVLFVLVSRLHDRSLQRLGAASLGRAAGRIMPSEDRYRVLRRFGSDYPAAAECAPARHYSQRRCNRCVGGYRYR